MISYLDRFHAHDLPRLRVKSRDDPISDRRGDSGVPSFFIYRLYIDSKKLETNCLYTCVMSSCYIYCSVVSQTVMQYVTVTVHSVTVFGIKCVCVCVCVCVRAVIAVRATDKVGDDV